MKPLKTLFFLILLVFTSGFIMSCQEETVQPATKDGNYNRHG